MMGGGKNDSFMSDINVTPFVDVMLVLLIIFMVTAPMMMQGVDVALPEATAEPLLTEEQDQLLITIDNQSRVFINDIQVSVEELNTKLKKILSGRSDRQVYLKADKGITYGKVVRVMSEIKMSGVEKLGMVTLPVTAKDTEKKK
jgi:biopolymer transport protein TolR